MAFYERQCATGAFVYPIPKKLIFQTFTIPAKLQATLKLSNSACKAAKKLHKIIYWHS